MDLGSYAAELDDTLPAGALALLVRRPRSSTATSALETAGKRVPGVWPTAAPGPGGAWAQPRGRPPSALLAGGRDRRLQRQRVGARTCSSRLRVDDEGKATELIDRAGRARRARRRRGAAALDPGRAGEGLRLFRGQPDASTWWSEAARCWSRTPAAEIRGGARRRGEAVGRQRLREALAASSTPGETSGLIYMANLS